MRGRRKGFKPSPFSKRNALAHIDGRSREGMLYRGTIRVLLEQLEQMSGLSHKEPTSAQLLLVQRTAACHVRFTMLDSDIINNAISPRSLELSIRLSNSIARNLRTLGLTLSSVPDRTTSGRGSRQRHTSIDDLIAQSAA